MCIYIYIYIFRASIPEAWEAGRLAGRQAGWLAGSQLTYLASCSDPLYIALEPRFLRPGRLGRLGGWLAGRPAVNVPCDPFGTFIYVYIPLEPRFLRLGRLGGWLAGVLRLVA